jgi:ATP-dependent Clp protease ATP-binding subunit ClpA
MSTPSGSGTATSAASISCSPWPPRTSRSAPSCASTASRPHASRRKSPAGAALFGDLDRDALAAIGIDVNAVRASIEASFGPEALTSASQALHREPRVRRLDPRRVSGAGRDGVFLPHSPNAEQSLRNARVAAQARHDTQIGVEHLALGLLAASEGPVPSNLSALAVSAAQLRAAILDRYRQAS